MNFAKKIDFSERLSAQAEAKKALLAKLQPKPTVTATELVDRNARREAELQAVREARAAEREAARIAREEREEAERQAIAAAEAAAQDAKRAERKERKQTQKQDARSRKAQRLAEFMTRMQEGG